MKTKVFLILIIVLCGNSLLAQGNNIEMKDLRKNSVYLEFGGIIIPESFSVNYDRTFALGKSQYHSLGLVAGFMITRWGGYDNDFSIPLEGYYLLGKRICFETGFTYAYCFGKPDFYAIGIRAGLRWRDINGILLRLAVTPTIANDGIEVYTTRLYGISMGYSF